MLACLLSFFFLAFSISETFSETCSVCVYSTWLTCSRRAGCQQWPHHFTSTQSDTHHCQEDYVSTSQIHTQRLGSQLVIYSWSLCVCLFVCMNSHSFHFSKLCLTSCACWLYLHPSPGLPALGEQTASRRTVTQHQLSAWKQPEKVGLKTAAASLISG